MFWTRNKPTGQARPRRRTLAADLTLWYGVPMSLLVFGICAAMYLSLKTALIRESDSRLENEVDVLRHLVDSADGNRSDLIRLLTQETRESEGSEKQRHRNQSGRLFVLRVIGTDGRTIVARSLLSAAMPRETLPSPSIEPDQLAAEDRVLPDGRSFRVMAATVGPADAPLVIQIATATQLEDALLLKYRRRVLATLAIGITICLAISYMMARLAIRPVRRIARSAEGIGNSNLHERIATDDLPRELAQLATSFNTVLEHLSRSFTRLSQFTGDIAHELRTPVAVLRGEMEIALLRARTEEEYRNVLASALEESGRMQKLIDRLLFLARADNHDAATRKEPLDVAVELHKIGDYFGLHTEEAGLSLRVSAPDDLKLNLDRVLFQSAVGNLVENAIQHTPAGGTILLKADRGADGASVEVSDSGAGIPPEHLPFVCDRLYQADASRTRKAGHVGLGLALVKAIAELHGGRIELSSRLGVGTTAILSFPFDPPTAAA
ncbi:MAG: heavy metal sensor histidine kinase [Tepidisphaeraceae bacterium]